MAILILLLRQCTPLNALPVNTSEIGKSLYFKGFSGVFNFIKGFENLTSSLRHIFHIDGGGGTPPAAEAGVPERFESSTDHQTRTFSCSSFH